MIDIENQRIKEVLARWTRDNLDEAIFEAHQAVGKGRPDLMDHTRAVEAIVALHEEMMRIMGGRR
jgi:hypothetical protein